MPFVTQPTESALAHRDSWAKSKLWLLSRLNDRANDYAVYSFLDAIENVHKDSMAKDASTSAVAKMEQSMYFAVFSVLTRKWPAFLKILYSFRCHASSGKCDCKPGWTGIFCDTPCPAGRYGQDCQEKCDCKNGATCSHITGKILPSFLALGLSYFSSIWVNLRFTVSSVFNLCEEVKDLRQLSWWFSQRYNAVFNENRSYKKVTESAQTIWYTKCRSFHFVLITHL